MFSELKILELSNVLAGPAVGMFFAELGAQVIKVENKLSNGDLTRNWKLPNEKNEDLSAYFCSVNYGKTHLFLNFKDPDDQLALKELIKECDIIITNFKHGDDLKFHLDFDRCKTINPKIIYAHIGGFKSNTNRVAFDIILQAETGFISMTGNSREYAKMPVALIDVLAAHQIKEGILTAMIQQSKDSKAIKVSTTLEETAIASLMNQSSNYLMESHIAIPMGTLHPNIAPYGEIIETIDQEKLILAIGTDQQFLKFSNIIQLEKQYIDLFSRNDQRVQNRDFLKTKINEKTSKLKSKDILALCADNYIPIGKIKTIEKVLNSAIAKKMVLEEKIKNKITKRIKTVVFQLSH